MLKNGTKKIFEHSILLHEYLSTRTNPYTPDYIVMVVLFSIVSFWTEFVKHQGIW